MSAAHVQAEPVSEVRCEAQLIPKNMHCGREMRSWVCRVLSAPPGSGVLTLSAVMGAMKVWGLDLAFRAPRWG